MQLVGVHIVPTRDLRHTHARRKALLDNPSLLSGRPPSPALTTHQHRSRRHACSLICQLMSKPRTRDSPKPERGRSDAYPAAGDPRFEPLSPMLIVLVRSAAAWAMTAV